MTNPKNLSKEEVLAREFESWQKQYYDNVYSLFLKRDEQRLVIAFNNWEDRFINFLVNRLPRLADVYKIQTSSAIRLEFYGGNIQNFKLVKSDKVEAFLSQNIIEAREGNLSIYDVKEKSDSINLNGTKFINFLNLVFISTPKTLGRLFFDIFGQGDKAAESSTLIIGYIIVIVFISLILGFINPNTLLDIYNFFFPQPK